MFHLASLIRAVTFCFAMAALATPSAFAIDLSNNLSAISGGTEAATTTRWLAASFSTDSSPHTLNSVTLRLANSVTGAAQVSLYTTSGLQPGTLVAHLTSPTTYSASLSPTEFTTTGLNLSASTTYWIVLKAVNGQFDWSWATDDSGTGTGFTHTWGVSDDSGAFWWSQDVYATQLSVTVDSCSAPAIANQPSDSLLCPGGMTTLSVSASGTGLAYQWRKANENLADGGHIAGSTTASLVISSAAPVDAGDYDVVITGTCGNATSNTATLTFCAADFNCSGGAVSVQDIFDFLTAYFASDSRADFNGIGGVTVQDIFDFLGAYFAGCE